LVHPVVVPLFTRYLFVAHDNPDLWRPIRETPGIASVITAGGKVQYARPGAVEAVQAAQAFAATSTRNEAQWHLGDAVAPRVGPFSGLPGVILAVEPKMETATVGILFLGQLREVVYPADALVSRDDF
jgi:transcription antitermination factor NusG